VRVRVRVRVRCVSVCVPCCGGECAYVHQCSAVVQHPTFGCASRGAAAHTRVCMPRMLQHVCMRACHAAAYVRAFVFMRARVAGRQDWQPTICLQAGAFRVQGCRISGMYVVRGHILPLLKSRRCETVSRLEVVHTNKFGTFKTSSTVMLCLHVAYCTATRANK
jgi:hypothetical protein